MNKRGTVKINYISAIIAAIVAIIVFCVISVMFDVMPLDVLPANFIGATLGALIGALITLVLLRGQTDIEEKKGKDIRILEKKTEIFQDYIKEVWKVWEDQKITIEEFQILTSKYYQNLMIYLKEDRLEIIGKKLSVMGKNIGKGKRENVDQLRDSIVCIINELSQELELGGEVNTKIMDEHDKIVFPLLFKNSILDALNNELPTETILEKGKYENFREGRWNAEHLCFNFKQYKDCKIIIGGFDGPEKLWFVLVVDKNIHQVDSFRASGVWSQRINDSGRDLRNPINDKDFEESDKDRSPKIHFFDENSMEIYRTTKREFANVLAKRAAHYFSEVKIGEDGIVGFLDKYIKGDSGKNA